MNNIGVLLTSRNNYEFMEKFWIPNMIGKVDIDFKILNIDEDSTKEEKDYGRRICEENGIFFMNREEKGMHHNIDTATRFFGNDIKYIIWFQHDCWPLQKDFFSKFNGLVHSGKLKEFGTVGFNALAQNMFKNKGEHKKMIEQLLNGEKPMGVLSRSHLESAGIGDMYYCGHKIKNRIKQPVPKKLFLKPFACSVPIWYAIAINVSQFKKYIDMNRKFYFFKSWDDISCQFLNKNIYNIVLPDFYIEHRPDLKRKVGLPQLSNKPVKKGNETYHQSSGYNPKYWIKQWGWVFSKPETFEKVKHKYKGTLLECFYKYDYRKGPLKVFDI